MSDTRRDDKKTAPGRSVGEVITILASGLVAGAVLMFAGISLMGIPAELQIGPFKWNEPLGAPMQDRIEREVSATVEARMALLTLTPDLVDTPMLIEAAVLNTEATPTPSSTPSPTSSPTLTPEPTATFTSTATPEPTFTPTPEEKAVIVDASIKSSSHGDVFLIVDKVEMLRNGRMRWYISLWNQTDETVSTAFGADRSYVTDEFGTEYRILSMSESNLLDSGVRANVRKTGWLEFSAPTPGAMNFNLYLVRYSYGFQQLVFDGPVEVFLDEPLTTE